MMPKAVLCRLYVLLLVTSFVTIDAQRSGGRSFGGFGRASTTGSRPAGRTVTGYPAGTVTGVPAGKAL